jgi:hypothetical protein
MTHARNFGAAHARFFLISHTWAPSRFQHLKGDDKGYSIRVSKLSNLVISLEAFQSTVALDMLSQ